MCHDFSHSHSADEGAFKLASAEQSGCSHRSGERNRPPRGSSLRIFRLTMVLFVTGGSLTAQQPKKVDPQQLVFKDDSSIPNNTLPLLLYREAFAPDTKDLASVIEQRFAENDWTGSWRAGVYPGGRQWDLLRGLPGERPQADRNIAAVPLPDNDPVYGSNGPLKRIWKSR